MLGKLAEPLMKVAFPLAKNVLAPLTAMASVSTIDVAIQWKMCGRGVAKAGKGIILVIPNNNRW